MRMSKKEDLSTIQPEEWVKWITQSQSINELSDKYDKWADSYDSSVEEVWSSVTKEAALMLSKYLPNKSKTVLDVGAGTGLSGVALADVGFIDLIGIDLSAAMLEKAASKKVYNSLVCCTINEAAFKELPKVAGMIATGVFAEAQAGAIELQLLQKKIEPNGIFVFTTRQSFLPKLESTLNSPTWELTDSKMMGIYEDPMYLFAYRTLPVINT